MYGFKQVGFHTVINLRVKLSDKNFENLREAFKDQLWIRKSMKGYTLIEGCIKGRELQSFWHKLQINKLESRRAELDLQIEQELANMYGNAIDAIGPEDIDLPW